MPGRARNSLALPSRAGRGGRCSSGWTSTGSEALADRSINFGGAEIGHCRVAPWMPRCRGRGCSHSVITERKSTMSDHQHGRGMPIDRRVGFLDVVLADAVDWYVAHPLHKPWQGGERGDPYMLAETDENHRRVDAAARAFLSDLHDAITNLHCSAEGITPRRNHLRRTISGGGPH